MAPLGTIAIAANFLPLQQSLSMLYAPSIRIADAAATLVVEDRALELENGISGAEFTRMTVWLGMAVR